LPLGRLTSFSAVTMQPLSFDPIGEAARQWRTRWGEDSAAPMAAVTSVMRAHQLMLSRLNAVLEPHRLTFPRYEALMLLYLSRRGSLPLGKMGRRLQVHQTSVTPLIDALVAAGMVERVPHPTDRRTTLAAITAGGKKVAAAATRDLNRAQFGTAPLTEAQLERLTKVLEVYRREAGDFS
jgi:DNA-binding MarR family transcriptional regulator